VWEVGWGWFRVVECGVWVKKGLRRLVRVEGKRKGTAVRRGKRR